MDFMQVALHPILCLFEMLSRVNGSSNWEREKRERERQREMVNKKKTTRTHTNPIQSKPNFSRYIYFLIFLQFCSPVRNSFRCHFSFVEWHNCFVSLFASVSSVSMCNLLFGHMENIILFCVEPYYHPMLMPLPWLRLHVVTLPLALCLPA